MRDIPVLRRNPNSRSTQERLGTPRSAARWLVLLALVGVCSPAVLCRVGKAQATAAAGRLPREPKHAERDQIETLEEQFRKAQLDGDVVMMDKLLSEDYLGINANGELATKAQQLDHMRNRTLMLTQLDPSDVKIKLIGTTAIVTSVVQVEGMLDGTALRGRYRYTRVYQRVPSGTWKVTSFEITRIRRPND